MEEEPRSSGSVVRDVQVSGTKLVLATDWSSGIGGDVWTTGMFLCEHFSLHPFYKTFLQNKKVIELGAGTGLVGIYLARLVSADAIVLTDTASHLKIMSDNVALNEGGFLTPVDRVCCSEYDWNESCDQFEDRFDVVVATDVVYSPELYEPFINALTKSVHEHSVIFLGVTKTDTKPRFFDMLKEGGFIYYKIRDQMVGKDVGASSNPFGLFVVFRQSNS